MNFKLKTSKTAERILRNLSSVSAYGCTPNILARIAVALSLKEGPVSDIQVKDANGFEFNRHTLTGEYDNVFKVLIEHVEGRSISDEEYFPGLFKAHLERGLPKLAGEYKYAGNFDKLIKNLIANSMED
ncbi:MAG: DndE family protein [Bacillota bacterium]